MAMSRSGRFRVIGTLLGAITAFVFKDTVSTLAGDSFFLALVFLGGTGAIVGTLFDNRAGNPHRKHEHVRNQMVNGRARYKSEP